MFNFDSLNKTLAEASKRIKEEQQQMMKEFEDKQKKAKENARRSNEEKVIADSKQYTDNLKKIYISSNCSKCGICSQMSEYIDEDQSGIPIPTGTGIIPKSKIDVLQEVIELCPSNSIQLLNAGTISKQGKEGLQEIKKTLEKSVVDFKQVCPTRESYKFDRRSFNVEYISSSKSYCYDYSSFGRADRAGESEFDRLIYSRRKSIVQEILVDYRINYLEWFLKDTDASDNLYHIVRRDMKLNLEKSILEINSLLGKDLDLEKDFCTIKSKAVFDEFDALYQLKNLEKSSIATRIVSNLEPISYYDIDTDDNGNGKWCFNISSAIDEFSRDIVAEIDYGMSDSSYIEDVEGAMPKVFSNIAKEYENKVNHLLKFL